MPTNLEIVIGIIKLIAFTGILLYIILIGFFFFAWITQKRFIPSSSPDSEKFISIIVAVRNEEKNLPHLIYSLQNQLYPSEQFEIIIIDDHSTDNTPAIIEQFSLIQKNVYNLSLSEGKQGKKAALRYGIEKARGELIVTTDADCRMNPEWLSTIVAFQEASEASLIIAPVTYLYNNSFFEKIQTLEFASLIASGAAAAILGSPILCNGANLTFLKSVYPVDKKFIEMNSPSGDDIFLLLHLKKTLPDGIHFLNSRKSLVYTNPSKGLKEFINQRKRWYGKSIHYIDPEITRCGMLVGFANCSLLIALVLAITVPSLWAFFFSIYLLKLLADMAFLYPYLSFIQASNLLWLAPILEVLYPFYIFYIVIAARIGKYKWKEREYRME